MEFPCELTLNSFEAAVQTLINRIDRKPDHFVINCMRTESDKIEEIRQAIINATPDKLLYNFDLRLVYHTRGNPLNWTLEACTKSKTLALIGKLPTA